MVPNSRHVSRLPMVRVFPNTNCYQQAVLFRQEKESYDGLCESIFFAEPDILRTKTVYQTRALLIDAL